MNKFLKNRRFTRSQLNSYFNVDFLKYEDKKKFPKLDFLKFNESFRLTVDDSYTLYRFLPFILFFFLREEHPILECFLKHSIFINSIMVFEVF